MPSLSVFACVFEEVCNAWQCAPANEATAGRLPLEEWVGANANARADAQRLVWFFGWALGSWRVASWFDSQPRFTVKGSSAYAFCTSSAFG